MLKTRPFDAAEVLDTPEAQAEYLTAALEEGDPAEVAHALGVVARARGMATIARESGLARESLYRALSAEGNPSLTTVIKVMESLGLRLAAAPAAGLKQETSRHRDVSKRRATAA